MGRLALIRSEDSHPVTSLGIRVIDSLYLVFISVPAYRRLFPPCQPSEINVSAFYKCSRELSRKKSAAFRYRYGIIESRSFLAYTVAYIEVK